MSDAHRDCRMCCELAVTYYALADANGGGKITAPGCPFHAWVDDRPPACFDFLRDPQSQKKST